MFDLNTRTALNSKEVNNDQVDNFSRWLHEHHIIATARWIATIALGLLLLIAFFILITTQFLGWRFDAVTTSSMVPALKIGGLVIIRPVDPTLISTNDIITFESAVSADIVITHRVIEVITNNGLAFRTKGDANKDMDSRPIHPENVVGKLWLYVPLIGYAVSFIKTPLGLALCIMIPGALLIWGEIRHLKQAKEGN